MSTRKLLTTRQAARRIRLRDLDLFATVAEQRSMAKAAADLGVAQPTVSEAIADLEATYGVRLFDRSPQGVALTVYGEALLKRSAAIFDEIKQSAMDIEFLSDPTVGNVRIASVESLSATILPDIILHFGQRFPRVILQIENLTSPAAGMSALRDRKYDLVMVRPLATDRDELAAEDLSVLPLFDDGLVVAVGSHNPLAPRKRINLAELSDEPWIFSPPGYWHHTCVEEAFRAQGLEPPEARIVTVTVTLRMLLIAAGPYISLFGSSVVRQYARRFGITALPVEMPTHPWPAVIVTLKNRTQSPVVQRFIEIAQTVAMSFSG
jgi:DNA-binding transcriptional LysR family regulator